MSECKLAWLGKFLSGCMMVTQEPGAGQIPSITVWGPGQRPRPLTRPELLELAAEITALAGPAPEGGEA